MAVEDVITFENADIGFRNFSGKEGRYNRAGDRNFCLFLDSDLGHRMESDGWNIKWLTPRDETEEPRAYMQVALSFRGRPPRVVMVTSRNKTQLDEDAVGVLDFVEIQNVDLIVNPYDWEVNGNKGRKAYVKSIYVTIVEDELERKYVDVPDSAANSFNANIREEEPVW